MHSLLAKSLFATLLFLSCVCCACVIIPDGGTCSEPGELEPMTVEEYASAIYSQTNSQYPGWHSWHSDAKSLHDVPSQFQDVQREHFSGDINCTAPKHSKRERLQIQALRHKKNSINHLALCQWEFVKNIDSNRKPEVLLEAVCACKFPNTDHPGLFCERVYQHVTVFRKTGCDVGEYVYERVSERISVACVTVAMPTDKKFIKGNTHSHMGQN